MNRCNNIFLFSDDFVITGLIAKEFYVLADNLKLSRGNMYSVGTVLISQLTPCFGTVALVPTASRYRLRYLGSGPNCLIPGFWHKVFRGLFAFSHFGTSSVTFWFQIN